MGIKIAISGKGGSGKTLLAAMLGYLFAKDGSRVYLIDADPDSNLGLALGISGEELSKITPIMELKHLIYERTGAANDTSVSENIFSIYFKLNPKVDDIPDKFSLTIPINSSNTNLHLLILGNVKRAGSGCYCPENAFLRALLSHLVLSSQDVAIIDMPAGIEIFSRGTAKGVNKLIVMVEPIYKSLQTALRIINLGRELGIKEICYVGNKIFSEEDIAFIEGNLNKENLKPLGWVHYSEELAGIEKKSLPVYQNPDIRFQDEIKSIYSNLAI